MRCVFFLNYVTDFTAREFYSHLLYVLYLPIILLYIYSILLSTLAASQLLSKFTAICCIVCNARLHPPVGLKG